MKNMVHEILWIFEISWNSLDFWGLNGEDKRVDKSDEDKT